MSGRTQSESRRVIVGLCYGAPDAETMRTAAEFAHLLSLNLHCLFIEDEALFALAELPFAREIRLPTHTWSPLTTEAVEAGIHQAAIEARRLMDEIIRDVGVPSEFEVLRGDPATCIAAVCQTGDIVVVVAEHGLSAVPTTHSLTRLRAGAHEATTSILLLPTRLKARHGAVVAMLTDGEDPALDMACRLATTAREDLVILLPEQSISDAAEKAEAVAIERAQAMGLPHARISAKVMRSDRIDDELQALVGVRERLIVMTRTLSAAAAASRILVARRVPVLLVEAEPTVTQS
jgi:hypothetical protein